MKTMIQKAPFVGPSSAPVQTPANAAEPVSLCCTRLGDGGYLGLLMHRALGNLSAADLECLSDASTEAAGIAARAAELANGVACLVMSDRAGAKPNAGNFQDSDDTAELLLHFADTFRLVASLGTIGADASAMLREKGGAA